MVRSAAGFGTLRRLQTMSSQESDYSTLKDLLCRKSVRLGNFTLASGEKSTVYVDSKLTTFRPEAMPLVGRLFLKKIRECGWFPEAVGGLTLGADPIAFSIARESLGTDHPIPAFVVRKEQKTHGMGRQIAGIEDPQNVAAVIIDDVCTKGGSTAQAIEQAQAAGMKILGAVCLVDRRQGATELLHDKFGLRLESIFTLPQLVEYLQGAQVPVGVSR
jgi:orotate phosphoribosyltransferase